VIRALLLTACFAISIPAASAQTAPTPKIDIGEISGAAYRIELPANWNRDLVVFAHGYTQPPPYGKEPPAVQQYRNVFLSRGFAFAESAYRYESSIEGAGGLRAGWAIKEGIDDTEALRKHFVTRYGKPRKTFIVGESMGAVITLATIERHPDAYNGALPMCGPLVPATEFLNYGILDVLVTFDYFFPNILGSPFEVNPSVAEKARAAFQAEPEKAATFLAQIKRPRIQGLPGTVATYQQIAAELTRRAGGNPFDNSNRVYRGYGDDAAVNRGVKRYTADRAALEYIRQYYSPTGRIHDPVLALVVTGDPWILGDWVTGYELSTLREGTQDRFVARFVDAVGHCNYTREQMGRAFDALVEWERDGKRPAGGEQK
jgi:pimeloyl-ACP methyl ester carboxylesterase